MFQMPMSSPMMTTMFGFGCWAAAGAAMSTAAANRVTSRSNRLRFWLGIGHFPRLLGCRAHGLAARGESHRGEHVAARAKDEILSRDRARGTPMQLVWLARSSASSVDTVSH